MRQIVFLCGVAAVLMCSANSARAQTVAVGPYYATPSWDQTIACVLPTNCTRFVVLSNFSEVAVLDRETGLVWERSPSPILTARFNAPILCSNRRTGGRQGWRLPRMDELMSLADPAVINNFPNLPTGHPFTNIQPEYWVMDYIGTTFQQFLPALKVRTNAPVGQGGFSSELEDPLAAHSVWCVRGGAGTASPGL